MRVEGVPRPKRGVRADCLPLGHEVRGEKPGVGVRAWGLRNQPDERERPELIPSWGKEPSAVERTWHI